MPIKNGTILTNTRLCANENFGKYCKIISLGMLCQMKLDPSARKFFLKKSIWLQRKKKQEKRMVSNSARSIFFPSVNERMM